MILKWHINIYAYSMIILAMLLCLLILPNKLVITKATPESYNSNMEKLAEQNLNANTSKDRAKITRQYNSLKTQEDNKSGNTQISLLPIKIIFILLMAIFTYSIIRSLWVRRPQASKQKA